ncbi:MAG: GTPase ObgE, partial [Legionellales bacterium]|nr:GTPase ObgE [Legionellales bacterium]
FPNAGKSTLISHVSAAKPKVADYPFTTLHPNLGVVSVEPHRSFVVADIPGLIEGAATGAGLGIQFLKHLMRTQLLLHLVDVMPTDGSDPVQNVQTILNELAHYSDELLAKPQWLVLTKIDLIPQAQRVAYCTELVKKLKGVQQRWFQVSAVSREGLESLCQQLMQFIEEQR